MDLKFSTTKDYWLWVDTEVKTIDFKTEDVCFERETGQVKKFYKTQSSSFVDKIIACRPLNNAPVLEGVLLLPEPKQEEDVVYEAIDRAYKYMSAMGLFTTPRPEARIVENLLIQARVRVNEAVSQKKWSDKEVKHLCELAAAAAKTNFSQWGTFETFIEGFEEWWKHQSLSADKVPVGFEPEYEETTDPDQCFKDLVVFGSCSHRFKFKTIKTEAGEVLQGRYVYA